MPYTDQDFVALGARFSTQRVIEQCTVAVAMARAHADELGARFPKAKVDELAKYIERMPSLYDEQAEAKFTKATGNVPVNATLVKAKHWISDMIAAADNTFEEDPEIMDKYHQGGKIGRSVPKVLGRMETLVTIADSHKDQLAAWGFTAEHLTEGKKLMAELRTGDTAQEKAVKDLPPKTRELYAVKGKAYLLLKRLSRTARTTFRHDPTIAAKLNLDILNRHSARRTGTPA